MLVEVPGRASLNVQICKCEICKCANVLVRRYCSYRISMRISNKFESSRRPVFYKVTGVLNVVLVLIGLPDLFRFTFYLYSGFVGIWCLYCVVYTAIWAQAVTDRSSYSGYVKLKQARSIAVSLCVVILLGILLTGVGMTELQADESIVRYIKMCGVYLLARWILLWTSGNWGTLEDNRNRIL